VVLAMAGGGWRVRRRSRTIAAMAAPVELELGLLDMGKTAREWGSARGSRRGENCGEA
jgi:hypothetical protein